jgi:hypothetical protein|nr:MAG TPA: hypothetical protein [Caudoviricetes sp.]
MLARVLTFLGMEIGLGCLTIENKDYYITFDSHNESYTSSGLFKSKETLGLEFVTESLRDDKVIEEYKNAKFTVFTKYEPESVSLVEYLLKAEELPKSIDANSIFRLLLTMYAMYKFDYTTTKLGLFCSDANYLATESGIYLRFVKVEFTGKEFRINVSTLSNNNKGITAVMTIEELKEIVRDRQPLLVMTYWMANHFNIKK